MLAFRFPAIGAVYLSCILNNETNQTFLPVTELFTLFEIGYEPDVKNFTIRGNYLSSENPFVINLNTMQIQLGRESFALTPDDFRIRDMDFYLSPFIFEKVFGLVFTVNIDYLNLTLVTDKKLPVQEKQEREEQRNKTQTGELKKDYPLAYNRARKILGGAMVDYALNGIYTANSQSFGYTFTGGMEVLGGDIQGTVIGAKTVNSPNSLLASGLRWRFVVRDNPFFATFTAGQMSTTGLLRGQIRGISISNDPVEPRRNYDTYVFDGHTEPESEVELYLNDRLIGYMRADELGYYRFNVPITYGTSRLSTRVYTPSGEVKMIDREMQVPFTFLPQGVVSYNLQGGIVEDSPTELAKEKYVGHGDVGVGIAKWLTVSAGADYFAKELWASTPLLYSSISTRIAKQYLITADIAPDNYYRLSGSVMYPSDLSINLVYSHFPHQGKFNLVGAMDDIVGNVYLPLNIFGMNAGIRLGGQQTQLPGSTTTKYNVDLSSRIWQFNFRANYRHALSHIHDFILNTEQSLTTSLTYTIARTPGVPVYVRGMFIRAQAQYNFNYTTFIQADLQLSRTLFKNGRLNINLGYNFLQKNIATEVGFTLDLNAIRSTTTFNSFGSETAFRESLNGSVGVDARNGKLDMSNREQVGRSAVSIVSYIDNNNSGVYDKGDEILPYNSVTLDNPVSSKVGRDGVLRLSQLQSYYRYNLKVNRNAISDPTLVPLETEFSFVTDPNQYKRIEIAFYRGGIVDGKVFVDKATGPQAQGGLRLLIKGITNKYEETVRTFSDGGFYIMDVPPGKYTIEVDKAQLGFLDVTNPQGALKFEIQALAQGDNIEGLQIHLIPNPEKDKTEEK
ncbi:MAG: hypothetical protein NT040_09410 [Bacteroidetes bacterium]|nr:hypothetical protein [Bacteroidota bacterium]